MYPNIKIGSLVCLAGHRPTVGDDITVYVYDDACCDKKSEQRAIVNLDQPGVYLGELVNLPFETDWTSLILFLDTKTICNYADIVPYKIKG